MLAVAEPEQLPVAAARAGSPEAWNTLFQRYQLPLYAYVFELIRDEQGSLDIVQEVFIAATKHLAGLRRDDRFGSWLFGIAHQKCIQFWRRAGREEPLGESAGETLAGEVGDPSELLIRQEQETQFMNLLEELPAPHRAVLVLHFLEDFSLEDISAITAVPLGTVKSRLHYAKRTLRARLEAQSA